MKRIKQILCFSMLSFAVHLQAHQFIPMGIEQLSDHADVIVHGTVIKKTTQKDEKNQIYTLIEIKIIDVWKGTVEGHNFKLVQAGGTLGNRRVMVTGQSNYQLGSEVVSFLVINQRGEGVTLGLLQGKFDIWTDAVSRTRLAANPFHGNTASKNGRSILQKTNPSRFSFELPDGSLTLEELKDRAVGSEVEK
ncbi:MAG TPA: hypothetical protein EYQ50_20035 [Verrucomicrobiales bacterium]|nr:hypothetical protein [Verrucomicrobiales bacterium]HIL71822.1 hypothetical protein [Verrucomicrobiota bacterium]